MQLHRTANTRPALFTVILASPTFFSAHDLGAGTGPVRRLPQAEKLGGASGGIPVFCSHEIRSLLLPFAAPLLSHNHLAAA